MQTMLLPSPVLASQKRVRHHAPGYIKLMLGFGLPGLFFISMVDSSFVPLPIPGSTDILLILLAARSGHWIMLTIIATAGAVIGGYASYRAGMAGGMKALERYVPAKYLKRVTEWTSNHSFLAVALPAMLPPPMPLIPFMLAAGALKMSIKRYMTSFTLSRALRHGLCAWLGVHYGRAILRAWNHFYDKWAATMLIVIWVLVIVSVGVPVYSMWKESQRRKKSGQPSILQEIGVETPKRRTKRATS
jgi:membrane protein DedA with SNARE-associated domain